MGGIREGTEELLLGNTYLGKLCPSILLMGVNKGGPAEVWVLGW